MTGDSRDIGLVVETLPGGRTLRQRITAMPGYGIVCERMSTNGDARYVADLAADRRGIVERHRRAGIAEYDLDVLLDGTSMADVPHEDALSRLIEAGGGMDHREPGYNFMAAARRERTEKEDA